MDPRAGGGPARWAVLDLDETLLDPLSLAPVVPSELADPEGLLRAALDDAALAAMALSHAGAHRPFEDLLGAALARRSRSCERPLAPSEVAELVAALAYATPRPGAGPALGRLAEAGVRVAVLGSAATRTAETALRTARLLDRVSLVVGADQVRAFRPDARVYRHGLAALRAAPAEAVMVAARWWDLLGAEAAGMRTLPVGDGRAAPGVPLRAPVAEAADLPEAAEAIAAQAGR